MFIYRAVFHSIPFEEGRIPQLSDDLIYRISFSDRKDSSNSLFDDILNDNLSSGFDLPNKTAFIELSSNKIIVEALKLAFGNKLAFVVRLYESVGGWIKTSISFPLL